MSREEGKAMCSSSEEVEKQRFLDISSRQSCKRSNLTSHRSPQGAAANCGLRAAAETVRELRGAKKELNKGNGKMKLGSLEVSCSGIRPMKQKQVPE